MLQIGVGLTTDVMSFVGQPFYFRDAFKTTAGVVFSSFHTCHLRSDWSTRGGPALIRAASKLFTWWTWQLLMLLED